MFPAYVISLEMSARRGDCAERFAGAGIDFLFVDAIDGGLLDAGAIESVFDPGRNAKHFKRTLSAGEIGCYLSHRHVWETIAAGAEPAAMVFEDDAILAPGLAAFATALRGFELDDVLIKFDGPQVRQRRVAGAVGPRIAGVQLIALETVTPHTTGYLIGRRAAARMLQARAHFFRPVDTDMKFVWEHGVPILATDPVLVHPSVADDSALQADRESLKPRSRAVRLLRNLRYQADFYLRRRLTPSPAAGFHLRPRGGDGDV